MMGVPTRHVLQQGPMLGALGRTAYLALRQRMARGSDGNGHGHATVTAAAPSVEIQRESAPLPQSLIDDYARYLGSDPRAYRGEVPPHLFPQWCMPALARTLEAVPYPLLRVLNGGCRVRVSAALPAGEPLQVRARLQDIDDDGQRAVLHQRVSTGPRSAPDALEIDLYAIVPLRRAEGAAKSNSNGGANANGKPVKERARVSTGAREVARIKLRRDAGLAYAKLSGDFNPIHWLGPYARASGFGSVILHGFGTLAFAWEGLNRGVFGGDVHAIDTFDAKFSRPLTLPHEVGLYVDRGQVFVGDAPGGPAYLTGTFSSRGTP
jgi:hypothetical protein